MGYERKRLSGVSVDEGIDYDMIEVVRFDSRVTSLSSVRKGIYRMSGTLGLICREDGSDFVVESNAELNQLEIVTLMRHVNDYQLRESISQETAAIRDAVLAAALIRITREHDFK